ncbi:uncharacterized protein SPPG_03252 [Spizellomyces punctatus DAOM BR117]|uniref:NADPH--hemoprotein reductase n=1 Tax=Spizellomyces punctatus (strain DAOM BR117) TaxID=645134 RepID=A0A0L0HK88_SPIPD|nr:uncharacterized protein SPPG_03252 [Spizellomyces punctatus DAOM BR117]KND01448.1 hypothetical protein SPPG_03252 [Spizellomyces punctatus DAOM BR117]|eukprot:XP_016609487.1 hypothetical protein SPPG_03252 [Spizellomyces punctatus DAOM BR117]
MALLDTTDIIILTVIAILTAVYIRYFKDSGSKTVTVGGAGSVAASSGPAGSVKPGSAESPRAYGKKSILKKLQALDHPSQLILFYGSQTGTAEDLATRIAKDTTTHFNIPTLICDPEEYDMTELTRWPGEAEGKKWLCGFFMATYGEGEPTDNVVEFYDWIMAGKGKGEDDGGQDDGGDDPLEDDALDGFKYIVFGLGNKTYEHYNAIGRRLDKRLKSLGGVRIGERGEGDDDASMEEDFLAWKPSILAAMAEYFNVEDAGSIGQRDKPHVPLFEIAPATNISQAQVFWGEYSAGKPRRWQKAQDGEEDYEMVDSGVGEKFVEVRSRKIAYDAKHPHYGRILTSKPLFIDVHDEYTFDNTYHMPRAGHKRYLVENTKVRIERHCLHVDLDISGSGLKYETGDHVGVWPVNDEEHLMRLAKALGLTEEELDKVVILKPNKQNMAAESAKVPFPVPCTVRTALLHYLDLAAIVKQYQLEILAKYCKDTAERDLLFELADNRELYVPLIERSRKDLADVLDVFQSIEVPIAVVLGELLPRIAVRYYSISSSSKEEPNHVGVTAVMVRYALPSQFPSHRVKDGKEGNVVVKQGIATSWLQRLHEARSGLEAEAGVLNNHSETEPIPIPKFYLPLYIRTSNFKLPRNPRLPVVMVGPGTGVAPFRAFVRERYHLASTSPEMKVGPTWLFYGCRHPDKDFLYRAEFEAMEKGVASGQVDLDLKVFKAYSRYEGKKVYVQHMVRDNGKDVWKMMGEMGGYFYVCGDAKHMAHDVQNALTELALKFGGMASEDKAKAWVKDLRTKGRYLEDVWS